MKKELLYLLMFVFTGFTFASCSDDDDPDYAKEIAKTYSGSLDIELNTQAGWVPAGTVDGKEIIIARTAQDVVSLQLKDFTFQEISIGNITVQNIAVTKSGDNYNLSGDDLDLSLPQLGKGKVKVTGTVDKDKKCTLKYIEIELDTQMSIRVAFTSK